MLTDLNTLFPKETNLEPHACNAWLTRSTSSGQISGMATVLSGPDTGKGPRLSGNPCQRTVGESIANVVRTRPQCQFARKCWQLRFSRRFLGRVRPIENFFRACAPSSTICCAGARPEIVPGQHGFTSNIRQAQNCTTSDEGRTVTLADMAPLNRLGSKVNNAHSHSGSCSCCCDLWWWSADALYR